jgi:hypothetical protein
MISNQTGQRERISSSGSILLIKAIKPLRIATIIVSHGAADSLKEQGGWECEEEFTEVFESLDDLATFPNSRLPWNSR